ncbi:MAG: MFS transporter, partial [Pyrinomonadaceae bacterium]
MDKALYSADGISTELVQSKKITQEEKRTRGRAIFATSLGHGLEYFDFTLYSYFAPTIGKLFFPAQGELVQLMLSLATFGIAYIARPLGSILIGSYADRAGRKPALMLTISLMAAGTAIIGLTPAYETIGILAPSLLVLGRLLQGVSAGGEAGASTAFLMESGGLRSRGFAVSWQAASQAGAALASACCVFMLAKSMDSEALASWGWRLPFLAGLLIGPLGFYLRRHLDDTLPVDNRSHEPATRILLQNWPKVLCAAMVVIGGTATTYTMFFLSSFSQITLHFSTAETSIVSGCVAVSVLFVAPLAGILTDRLLA